MIMIMKRAHSLRRERGKVKSGAFESAVAWSMCRDNVFIRRNEALSKKEENQPRLGGDNRQFARKWEQWTI